MANKRGFAAMSPQKRKSIAAKGGRASHGGKSTQGGRSGGVKGRKTGMLRSLISGRKSKSTSSSRGRRVA